MFGYEHDLYDNIQDVKKSIDTMVRNIEREIETARIFNHSTDTIETLNLYRKSVIRRLKRLKKKCEGG